MIMERGVWIVVLALAVVGSSLLLADNDVYVDDSYYWAGQESAEESVSSEPVYDRHAKELIFIDEPDTVAQPAKQHPDTVRMRVLRKQL